MNRCILLLVWILTVGIVPGQQEKYWISFKGVAARPEAYDEWVRELAHLNVRVSTHSTWLNSVSAALSRAQVARVGRLPFVASVSPVRIYSVQGHVDAPVGDGEIVSKQINAHLLKKEKLNGKDVRIGIIDGNFYKADQEQELVHLFKNKQIVACKNWVNPGDKNFFKQGNISQDNHGAAVLRTLAGRTNGLAQGAQYFLATTEDYYNEHKIEEDHWVAALEWMHSKGVRLVNSSLGYGSGFDDTAHNHSPTMMDGKSTMISRAAGIAVREKKMILIVSAGNEGNNDWRIINAPADVKEVITVGATNALGQKDVLSSTGNDKVGFTKPNLACFSTHGTSFAAPIITALVACILQAKPKASYAEITEILVGSCSLYPYCNTFIGCGIPNAQLIVNRLKNGGRPAKPEAKPISVKAGKYEIKLSGTRDHVVVFHKSDRDAVISQSILKGVFGKVVVERPTGVKFTTVASENVHEIAWEH